MSNASLFRFDPLRKAMFNHSFGLFDSFRVRPFGENQMCSIYGSLAKSFYQMSGYGNYKTSASHGVRWQSTNSAPDRNAYRPISHSLFRYFRSLSWYPIPLALGLAFIAYQRYSYVKKRESSKLTSREVKYEATLASELEISLLKLLPLRLFSRIWGFANSIYLPQWARRPVIGTYSRAFGCCLEEAEVTDISHYENLGQFFKRDLRPGIRPVAEGNVVVSPADGTVLHFGKIDNDRVEQVKGVTYSLPAFLGPVTWKNDDSETTALEYQKKLLQKKEGTSLYQCVIYLAPGDYHKFHSPVEWAVAFRRHFPGKLLSVRPSVASWVPCLFNLNERVSYVGSWMHGFFSMTAVGATNVGSIKVYCDKELRTNKILFRKGTFTDKNFSEKLRFNKGELFGEFNLGSTIVLVFEAPNDFQFTIESGDKIKYGQLLSFQCKQRTMESHG